MEMLYGSFILYVFDVFGVLFLLVNAPFFDFHFLRQSMGDEFIFLCSGYRIFSNTIFVKK